MVREYRPNNWRNYVMDWMGEPHPVLEPLDEEILEVDKALRALVAYDILPHTEYDKKKFLVHRNAVKRLFEIPWTGISPRMQRLIYAINAIVKPGVMVAIGIFCGNTFISNAGASIGPGACYSADRLIGVEIDSAEAERAHRNVEKLDKYKKAEIVTADGVKWISDFKDVIDLLYIDADGSYSSIIKEASQGKLHRGSLVLAHNSVNFALSLSSYLSFVRDQSNSLESVNVYIDDQGLEVTKWR